MAAYYAARKHGRWAFAFARYLSVPVRFRPYSQPAWPERGWEFDGEAYDPRCKYARAFPLVIIKGPDDLPKGELGEAAIRNYDVSMCQPGRTRRWLRHRIGRCS